MTIVITCGVLVSIFMGLNLYNAMDYLASIHIKNAVYINKRVKKIPDFIFIVLLSAVSFAMLSILYMFLLGVFTFLI